jgi:exonuclease III
MKIGTYNVRNLYDAGTFVDSTRMEAVSEHFFTTRVEYFIAQFKQLDLDIICLQEIGGEHGVQQIAEALSYDYALAKPNSRGIRVGVLYKKTIRASITCASTPLGVLEVPSIQVSGDARGIAPISGRRDMLVIDIVGLFEKPLRVVTFHLKSLLPEYLEGDDKEQDRQAFIDAKFRAVFYKMMELRALRAYANKSLEEGKEVIFLGDFNEHHNSSGLDILKSGINEEFRLRDVLVTYSGDKTTHMHRGNRITFDTLIVSPWVYDHVTHVSVENNSLRDYSDLPYGEIEHEIESDHALVWVEVIEE